MLCVGERDFPLPTLDEVELDAHMQILTTHTPILGGYEAELRLAPVLE